MLYELQPFADSFIAPQLFECVRPRAAGKDTSDDHETSNKSSSTNAATSTTTTSTTSATTATATATAIGDTSVTGTATSTATDRDGGGWAASLVGSSTIVVAQLSVVATFLAVYKYLIVVRDGRAALGRLVMFDGALLGVGHLVHRNLVDTSLGALQPSVLETLRGVFLFGVCLRVAVPVVQTLTSSFSGNTIHALAIALSTIHLVAYDYSFVHAQAHDVDAGHFSGTLSLNASMFTAVILASRLDDVETVFSFVLLAVICFSFYPAVARLLYQRSATLHLAATGAQCVAVGSMLLSLDLALFAIFVALVLTVWVVCPLCLRHMARYKKSFKAWDIVDVG